jgi:hypothetical protein
MPVSCPGFTNQLRLYESVEIKRTLSVDIEESQASGDSSSERDVKYGAVSAMMVGKVVSDGVPLR